MGDPSAGGLSGGRLAGATSKARHTACVRRRSAPATAMGAWGVRARAQPPSLPSAHSRNTETPGSFSNNVRLMSAAWSCPVAQICERNRWYLHVGCRERMGGWPSRPTNTKRAILRRIRTSRRHQSPSSSSEPDTAPTDTPMVSASRALLASRSFASASASALSFAAVIWSTGRAVVAPGHRSSRPASPEGRLSMANVSRSIWWMVCDSSSATPAWLRMLSLCSQSPTTNEIPSGLGSLLLGRNERLPVAPEKLVARTSAGVGRAPCALRKAASATTAAASYANAARLVGGLLKSSLSSASVVARSKPGMAQSAGVSDGQRDARAAYLRASEASRKGKGRARECNETDTHSRSAFGGRRGTQSATRGWGRRERARE